MNLSRITSVRARTCACALALLAASLAAPRPALAQSPVTSPVGLAAGAAAYDGLACGPDALAGNPAALARRCVAPVRVIIIPTVGTALLDNGAGAEIWRHRSALADGFQQESFGDMDPAAREAILASIPAEGYRHRNRLDLPVAQAGVGAHSAVSLTFTTAVQGVVARDLAELLLEGHTEGRTDYSVDGTDEWAHGYWTLAFGHGRSIPGIADVGVAARVMSGTFLTRWQAFGPEVSLAGMRAEGRLIGAFAGENLFADNLFNLRPPDGFGWSLDLGAMRDVGPLRLGLAVQNLIHGMRWADDIHLRTRTFVATPQGTTLETEEATFDPATASAEERQVAEALVEDARFPRRVRASVTLDPIPWATVSAGAVLVSGPGELDRDWDRRVGFGGQLRPLGFLRVQAGLATDLDGAMDLSGGLEVDLGRSRLGASAVRVREADGVGGWRLVAGFSRF